MSDNNGNGNGLPEAPASATARMTSPNGVEWLLTVRDLSASALLDKVQLLEDILLTKRGWSAPAGKVAAAGQDKAPICPEHAKTMQPSKHGKGWYCPVKIGEHPQTGKAMYCTHKVE